MDLILNFEFKRSLNRHEFTNSNRGDMTSLVEGYCSLIIRASQFSSTTRNLVPRFKARKGERFGYEILTDLLVLVAHLGEVDPLH